MTATPRDLRLLALVACPLWLLAGNLPLAVAVAALQLLAAVLIGLAGWAVQPLTDKALQQTLLYLVGAAAAAIGALLLRAFAWPLAVALEPYLALPALSVAWLWQLTAAARSTTRTDGHRRYALACGAASAITLIGGGLREIGGLALALPAAPLILLGLALAIYNRWRPPAAAIQATVDPATRRVRVTGPVS